MTTTTPESISNTAAERPLRICLITETYPPEVNGVAHTLSLLCAGLSERGHHVHLIRPRQHPHEYDQELEYYSTTLVRGMQVPFYRELRLGMPAHRTLRRLFNRRRPDVVYVATEGPLGRSAVSQARRHGLGVVTGFHTNFHSYTRHYGFGFLHRPVLGYLRKLHNQSQCTLVPTDALRGELERAGFHNVQTLSRGVDSCLFDPARRSAALRRSWGVADNDPVAIYVGRLAAEKDLPLAVHAYEAMRVHAPGLRLVLVGDGPMHHKLSAQYPGLIFSGMKTGEELASHYASADIFLFPSQTETFGNVVLEAMASGLAVVAFDYAGPKDLIRHGDNGLLAELGHREGFVEAAVSLVRYPEQLERIRRKARQAAEERAWDMVVERFEDILRGCRESESNVATALPSPATTR